MGLGDNNAAGSAVQACPLEEGWVELEMLGENDAPIANERFIVILADGTQRKGRTDARGFARVGGLPQGPCHICFPELDAASHEALGEVPTSGSTASP
ncbi:hypothetical protein HUW62_26800 [Myxococcus sp. AM011]|uniref:hypothetical protein n=1 Tax=Myxococcus sp. AM011 TaxID=2745200 RepID=UPI00159533A3|nr:hypothetical protein [Myxococcus sp. AM011]NVJ24839.1 hypothetical protein [Myxococcus sp. AM011]